MAASATRTTADVTAKAVNLERIGMNPLKGGLTLTARRLGVNHFVSPNDEGLTGFFAQHAGSVLSESRWAQASCHRSPK
jgi:hypothetical protein